MSPIKDLSNPLFGCLTLYQSIDLNSLKYIIEALNENKTFVNSFIRFLLITLIFSSVRRFLHRNQLLMDLFKVWTTVLGRKVKLMIFAKTVPITYRGKPGTHYRESGIGLFNDYRIVLEVGTRLTDRTGSFYLNGIQQFHGLMCHNRGPVMTENDDRQDVSQYYIHNYPDCKGDKGFDASLGKFAEPRGKSNT